MSDRIRKINELIREESSRAIAEEVKTDSLITVKAVETSPDIRHSVIWVSVLGNEEEALSELNVKKSNIQHSITSKMTTKYTPKIQFRLDHSEKYAERINKLLKDDHKEE